MKETLTFEEVMKKITNAMSGMEGRDVANLHNTICDKDIEYQGDSLWKLKGGK